MQTAVKVTESGDKYIVRVMGKLPGGIAHVRQVGGVAEQDVDATVKRIVAELESELTSAQ